MVNKVKRGQDRRLRLVQASCWADAKANESWSTCCDAWWDSWPLGRSSPCQTSHFHWTRRHCSRIDKQEPAVNWLHQIITAILYSVKYLIWTTSFFCRPVVMLNVFEVRRSIGWVSVCVQERRGQRIKGRFIERQCNPLSLSRVGPSAYVCI